MDKRLQAVLDSMPGRFGRLIDVGSDHALLPIEAISSKRCEKAIATELNQGPYSRTQAAVNRANLAATIEVRLGDGLCQIKPLATDVITLCGLGGREAARIIKEQIGPTPCLIIVQPEKSVGDFRSLTALTGYCVHDEKLVTAGRFTYQVISLSYDGLPRIIAGADRYLPTTQTDKRGSFDALTWHNYLRRLAKHADNLHYSEPETATELKRRIEIFLAETESENGLT